MEANTVLWFILINNIVWMIFFLLSRQSKKTINPVSSIMAALTGRKEVTPEEMTNIEEMPGSAASVIDQMSKT